MDASANLYSERLGRITGHQLQSALDHFRLGRLVGAEPIPHGHFGQNLFLTSGSGEYVLRGNPNYPGQFQTERFYAEALVRGTRVPVPWPYRIDTSTGIFGWSYVIMPRMPGLHLSDPDVRGGLEPEHKAAIARALSENLAEMHALTRSEPGRYHPAARAVVPLEPPTASVWSLPAPDVIPSRAGAPSTERWPAAHGRWVADRVLARLAAARTHDPSATVSADLAWAGSLLAARAPALAVPFQPCLVMEDYKEGNLVVARDAGRWTVSGVFDLGQSYFGDGESDLARTLCTYLDEDPELALAFVESYLARRPPRAEFARRAAVHLLLDRAILWEFFQRFGLRWWPATWTFRDWAGRYLGLMESVLARVPGLHRIDP